ncbi:MAG: NAD(P)H-dependent oxidoreductase [Bauldia sp.]|nr:MAG: NAD(P)H-dependent oxidoreductase [Bauldia sp.]MBZ0226826.1 NAD(P)H-dependent oxidoreductase [Bauldia sp.]
MRVFVLFAHPVETSYQAALHRAVIENLTAAGHDVDDCDLYAEGFDPVLSRDERLAYHDEATCRAPVRAYVDRLLAAEALVMNFPVWNFGYPAILKGFLDRVFLPGVSFRLEDGGVKPMLHNVRKLAAVVTYGGSRWRAMLVGDPPRKCVKRAVRAVVHPLARTRYIALYDMNNNGEEQLEAFRARVSAEMRAF